MAYLKIHLKKGQKVWYTSDTHYGHSNICRGTSSWDLKEHGGHDSVRDFDTLEDMNQAIVDGINKHVKEDDYMFHNGDWNFGGIYNIAKFRQQLFCKNIILIHGNHDTHIILY